MTDIEARIAKWKPNTTLDLRGLNLTSIPENLPISLRTLDISNNCLTSLIYLPPSLEALNCSNNNLTTLEYLPTSLITLNCSGNSISELSDSLVKLTLETLIISNNKLSIIRNNSLPLTLTSLDCYGNNLSIIEEKAFLGVKLIKLYCPFNKLNTLPSLPPTLQYLCCSFNKLTTFSITLPDTLKELICCDNQLTSLPDKLPQTLEFLQCSRNYIEILPSDLPSSLKRLWCSNNKIKQFLIEESFHQLEEIHLSNNPLTEFPVLCRKSSSLQVIGLVKTLLSTTNISNIKVALSQCKVISDISES